MNYCLIPPLEKEYYPESGMENWYRLPYRDSYSSLTDNCFWEYLSNSTYLDQINRAGAAVYLLGGWYDIWSRDIVILYRNLTLPKKMIIGPWFHLLPKLGINVLIEQLRFYDYWLKGISNGVMDEEPLYLNVLPKEDNRWEAHSSWPPKDVAWESWFLRSDKSAVDESANNHSLVVDADTNKITFHLTPPRKRFAQRCTAGAYPTPRPMWACPVLYERGHQRAGQSSPCRSPFRDRRP